MSVSIEEALAQLDPKLIKRLGSGVGVNYEYQPTPSFGLNRAPVSYTHLTLPTKRIV